MSDSLLHTFFVESMDAVIAPLVASRVTQPLLLSGSLYGVQDACAERIVEQLLGAEEKGKNATQADILRIHLPLSDSIDIGSIRELIEQSQLSGARGRRYIVITGIERMTTQASNALLKSIEEHTERTCWILTTSHIEGVPHTIRSRCRIIALKQMSAPELNEGFSSVLRSVPQGAFALWQILEDSQEARTAIERCSEVFQTWRADHVSRKDTQACIDLLTQAFPLYDAWALFVDCGIAILENELTQLLSATIDYSSLTRVATQLDFLKELRHTTSHHGNKTLIVEAFVCNIYDR